MKQLQFNIATVFAALASLLAMPVQADFTSSTSGLTTTYIETFEGSTSFSGGWQTSTNDDYLRLEATPTSAFVSFTFGALASLDLSFFYTARGPGEVGSMTLTGPGGLLESASFSNVTGTNPGPGIGAQYASSFTNLTAGVYTLAFGRSGSGDRLNIDDVVVTVTAVPEPASLALLLAGLGAVGLASRRQRKPGRAIA